jgi:tRNA 2-selenouridine synthase SelU
VAERPRMDAGIIKGQAKPIERRAPWQKKHPITVRLTNDQYRKLQEISTSRIPRITHQDVMVEALERYYQDKVT